jgi:hypothetical protein
LTGGAPQRKMNLPLTSFQVDVAAYLMIAMGVGAFIALQKLPSAYGRYSVGAGGCVRCATFGTLFFSGMTPRLHSIYALQMNGRVAWILQELPSLLGVIVTIATASREQQAKMQSPEFQPNKVLQGLFVLHYIHRHVSYLPAPLVLVVPLLLLCSGRSFFRFVCARRSPRLLSSSSLPLRFARTTGPYSGAPLTVMSKMWRFLLIFCGAQRHAVAVPVGARLIPDRVLVIGAVPRGPLYFLHWHVHQHHL